MFPFPFHPLPYRPLRTFYHLAPFTRSVQFSNSTRASGGCQVGDAIPQCRAKHFFGQSVSSETETETILRHKKLITSSKSAMPCN